MGGRKGNPDPALQTCVTGAFIPPAEGGTAFFSPRLPPLFFFTRILAFFSPSMDNGIRDRNRDFERRHNHEGIGIFGKVTVEDCRSSGDCGADLVRLDLCRNRLYLRSGAGA